MSALPDPLPVRRLLQPPEVRGCIKARAEDFLVDEIPLYEPCGEGEHLYLHVQKRDMAHGEMASVLAIHYGVGLGAIGFAGMKDRTGVTRQLVSIHLPGVEAPPPPVHERLEVLWQARHRNKLRRGHLRGNRFSIRIREVDPLKAPLLWTRLKALEQLGIPDYFGPQRFGYRRNTHLLGRLLLEQRYDEIVAELIGSRGSPFPEHQRPQRELADAGRYAESLPLWSRADVAERAAVRVLAAGGSTRRAVQAIHREDRAFWISALQSAVFNRVLDRRLEQGRLGEIEPGDVAFQHDNGALFLVTEADLDGAGDRGSLRQRLASFEISPSGPLPGPGLLPSAGRCAAEEAEAVRRFGAEALLVPRADGPSGARRPLRVRMENPSLEASMDEFGPYIRVAFDLPRGAYATVVLRELLLDPAEGRGQHDETGPASSAVEQAKLDGNA